jgi:transposase
MDTPNNLYYFTGGASMGEKNRHFSREFKINAVQLVTEKKMPVNKVAQELDIHPNLLHIWKRKYLKEGEKAFSGKGRIAPEKAEIRRLQKDLERIKEERDILKKALVFFRKQKR